METIEELYRRMYEMTKPECKSSCRVPRSCCSPEYCDYAESWARDRWGVVLERTDHPVLPFMGPNGCTVAPHLRPMCTYHTCDINGLGFKRGDQAWTDGYFALRDLIEAAEYQWQHDHPEMCETLSAQI